MHGWDHSNGKKEKKLSLDCDGRLPARGLERRVERDERAI